MLNFLDDLTEFFRCLRLEQDLSRIEFHIGLTLIELVGTHTVCFRTGVEFEIVDQSQDKRIDTVEAADNCGTEVIFFENETQNCTECRNENSRKHEEIETLFAVGLGLRVEDLLTLQVHGQDITDQGVIGFWILVSAVNCGVNFAESVIATDTVGVIFITGYIRWWFVNNNEANYRGTRIHHYGVLFLKDFCPNDRMSGAGNVEAMFAGIENLREGITQLLREIDRLKAENETLKEHVTGLQDHVNRAERYIEMMSHQMAEVTMCEERKMAEPMGRVLPHDSAAGAAEGGRKKKGGL